MKLFDCRYYMKADNGCWFLRQFVIAAESAQAAMNNIAENELQSIFVIRCVEVHGELISFPVGS